jgi:hypothetical protein
VPKNIDDAPDHVKEAAGQYLFQAMNQYLYQNGNPKVYCYLINGIGAINMEPYVRGFEMAKRKSGLVSFYQKVQGWDFWVTCEEPKIMAMWYRTGAAHGPSSNLWQSNGKSRCELGCEPLVSPNDVGPALLAKYQYAEIKKVDIWTIDRIEDQMTALDYAVDSIETSEPMQLWQLLQSPKYSRCFKLATWSDNLWTQVNPLPGCSKPLPPPLPASYPSPPPSYAGPSNYGSSYPNDYTPISYQSPVSYGVQSYPDDDTYTSSYAQSNYGDDDSYGVSYGSDTYASPGYADSYDAESYGQSYNQGSYY